MSELDTLTAEQHMILKQQTEDAIERNQTILKQIAVQQKQLEAFPVAMRTWIQKIADNQKVQAHAMDIIRTTKDLIYRNLFRFQFAQAYVDAYSCFANMVRLSGRFLPEELYTYFIKKSKQYSKAYQLLNDSFGARSHSRALEDGMFDDFYKLFNYLLNTRILTADEANKAYDNYVEERAKAFKEQGIEP